jgi:hypothetical protein
LPRIRSLLLAEKNNLDPDADPLINPDEDNGDWLSVLLKQDRIYRHNIMRLNYTAYDVRRGNDVIHPGTFHCNVIAINPVASDTEHPFLYARVLGIFHANVIYLGEGMVDHYPRRLEFLWVRWYQEDSFCPDWASGRLDRICFPPITDEHSFGFMDPADVLRGCHVVPAFSRGKAHPDGIGISHCARDAKDWRVYYVNRYEYICLFEHPMNFFLGLWIETC